MPYPLICYVVAITALELCIAIHIRKIRFSNGKELHLLNLDYVSVLSLTGLFGLHDLHYHFLQSHIKMINWVRERWSINCPHEGRVKAKNLRTRLITNSDLKLDDDSVVKTRTKEEPLADPGTHIKIRSPWHNQMNVNL